MTDLDENLRIRKCGRNGPLNLTTTFLKAKGGGLEVISLSRGKVGNVVIVYCVYVIDEISSIIWCVYIYLYIGPYIYIIIIYIILIYIIFNVYYIIITY